MDCVFDPGQPDGINDSLTSQISRDGTPEIGMRYRVPARCGVAARLAPGQKLTVENTHGTQVCDFWAFNSEDLNEYLSMEHLHTSLNSIYPRPKDGLATNLRRPVLTFLEDTSPGVHDTVIASCDHHRYRQLGCVDYHDNCTDNLRMALIAIGLRAPAIPSPFNIWMNTPVAKDGSIRWLPTVSGPGDKVVFGAELDCIAVMSACPQDLAPINGEGNSPTELHFRVDG
ncbi:MAG: urea carboxylase-associated family protein [Boseongicola sp. SB0675_bin_26]|nr:urea carboxylase-associated family protein [Boseongicola sp. SB0675_bin_26]